MLHEAASEMGTTESACTDAPAQQVIPLAIGGHHWTSQALIMPVPHQGERTEIRQHGAMEGY